MKRIIILCCVLGLWLWAASLWAQEKDCGTVVTEEQMELEWLDLVTRGAVAAVQPPVTEPYHIPLTIHIVRRSTGQGGFTLNQLDIAMRDLNRLWQPAGVQFFIYGDVDYIDSDYYFTVPSMQTRHDELRQVRPVANTINVYFTNLIGLCGVSTFSSFSIQGILINNSCAGESGNPSTLAHEVGHYFDLYHTHETMFGVECPNGSNCTTAGDLLCDTPADPGLSGHVSSSCVYDNYAGAPASCGPTPYAPQAKNIMSYASATCRDYFTPDQISRALTILTSRRGNLFTNVAYVDANASPFVWTCTYRAPCREVAYAIAIVNEGSHIFIKSGFYPVAFTANKRVTLGKWDIGPGVAQVGR